MPYWFPNFSRALSLVVASIYVGVTIYFAQRGTAIGHVARLVPGLLFILACIWFEDEMGDYVGSFPKPVITQRSPGWMVKVGGWILLLLPAILFYFIYKS